MDATLLIKVTLVLLVALAAAHGLRRAPAASRHHLWSAVFAAVLVMPFAAAALPVLHVPLPAALLPAGPIVRPASIEAPARASLPASAIDVTPAASVALESQVLETEVASDATRWPVRSLIGAVWLGGTLIAAGALLISLTRVRRLARSATPMLDDEWQAAAAGIASRLGLRTRVRLLTSAAVGTPMAGGVSRPTIFLPAAAHTWTSEQRDVVLAHEMAHLVARDPLRHLIARLTLACYWFHPLAWVAARSAMAAREQACDERVLALGTRPSAYARVLLDLAEAIGPVSAPAAALPMIQRTSLEARLMAILNDDVRPVTRWVVLVPAAVALMTVAMAAAQPAGTIAAAQASPAASAVPEPLRILTTPGTGAPATGILERLAATIAGGQFAADSACSGSSARSFSGSISTSERGGRTVIHEQIGSRGGDRVIQTHAGDVLLCMVAEGIGDRTPGELPSRWSDRAARVIIEAHRGGVVQRLEIAGGRTVWRIGGAERPVDAAVQQWRSRMLAVLDTTWELSAFRGQVSSMRGEISSIHGDRSSLHGEISSIRGEVSSMRGEISSVRGEESSLRGEISSIRGHVSSLRGAISSERGAMSSLNASRYSGASRGRVEALLDDHEKEIDRLEREIREYGEEARIAAVEKRIAALNVDAQVAAIEARIKAFDAERKIADVEKQLAALDVDGKVATIERGIEKLDVDGRTRQLEQRRAGEVKNLEAAMKALR